MLWYKLEMDTCWEKKKDKHAEISQICKQCGTRFCRSKEVRLMKECPNCKNNNTKGEHKANE